jgi:DNA (cytosine-5)-methyltransferase 1
MIPVIDLFAGPGGLGEGFSAYNLPDRKFKINISIEVDEIAHKTLLLRSFYRQFPYNDVPDAYYDFIKKKKFTIKALNKLLDSYDEGTMAKSEALCLELGKHNNQIFRRIQESLADTIADDMPWVLIGGPPCQAYSLVGRARNKGKIINEENNDEWSLETDKRSKLYLEYLKVLARFQPAVFIMENVKGMLSAKLGKRRVIDMITSDLQNPNAVRRLNVEPMANRNYSYKLFSLVKKHDENKPFEPSEFVIKCEDYGIPQRRHRVIIMGIREDYLDASFEILKLSDQITLKQTINDLPACFSSFSSRKKKLSEFDRELLKYDDWKKMIGCYFEGRVYDDFKMHLITEKYLQITGEKKRGPKIQVFAPEWFLSEKLDGFTCNHEPRTHIRSDFLRYFFVSCFGKALGRSPKLMDFPLELLPAHKNVRAEKFVDRFKVQLEDIPSTTITCHISKDGHYFIHPDPRQCRSLTVREAARLQTFPDDYFFCGNRTQQYHQVGNAVPPLLARDIAGIVYCIIKQSGKI